MGPGYSAAAHERADYLHFGVDPSASFWLFLGDASTQVAPRVEGASA
jgi:hypothetical protein